jgi:hypothetical protein
MKRREFLIGLSTACVAAGVVPVTAHATAPEKYFTGAPSLSRERFRQLLGSQFRVYAKNWNSFNLKLAAIKDGPASAGLEQFSLVFQGAGGVKLPPGTYLLSHRGDGNHLLYLDPAPGPSGVQSFVARFSLLTKVA